MLLLENSQLVMTFIMCHLVYVWVHLPLADVRYNFMSVIPEMFFFNCYLLDIWHILLFSDPWG